MADGAQDLYKKAINEIYNTICPTFFYPDGNAPPLTHIFCMKYPALGFDTNEYDPATTRGREALALLCNSVPQKQKSFVEKSKVDFEVRKFLSLTKLPADRPLTEEDKRKLAAAKIVIDDHYELYLETKTKYERALERYYALANQRGDPNERELNERLAEARNALDVWIARGRRGEVEKALNTLKTYDHITPGKLYNDSLDDYEMSARAGTTGSYYHVVRVRPGNWATVAGDPNSTDLAWTQVSLSEATSTSRVHKSYESMKCEVSVEARGFLWGGSASGGMATELQNISSQAKSYGMELALEVAAVDIDRSWFQPGLMRTPEARMPDYRKGQFSVGSMDHGDGDFDLVPTRIVLARGITLTNTFSKAEHEFMEKHKETFARAKVTYCGFSLSGGFSKSETTSDDSAGEGGGRCSITMPGPQIIGFVCSLNPEYPTEDYVEGGAPWILRRALRFEAITPLPEKPDLVALLKDGEASAARRAAPRVGSAIQ